MELSVNDLIELFKLASLGKLIGGLIHNINGPLQNIGLDLEMSQYMLRKETDNNGGKESSIMIRLKRIEDELDRLNTMIKASSSKIMRSDNSLLNFNEYLEHELSFLNANLYFKHNVSTTLQLTETPPLMSHLPENSTLAFSWFLQKVIEEMEALKKNSLLIKTEKENESLKIFMGVELTYLPDLINDILNSTDLHSDRLIAPDNQTDLLLVLKIFDAEGIVIETEKGQSANIAICFPLCYR